MKRRQISLWLSLAVLTGGGAIACGMPPASTPPAAELTVTDEPVALTVSAAASVQDALKDAQAAYQDVAPHVTITYNFGSSGSLAQQITQGAPTDVFLSASTKWMDEVEAQDQIQPGSRQDLLQNDIVLVVPPGETAIKAFADLATGAVDKVAIGEPDSVPAGRYAKETLTSLNLFEPLQPQLVFTKDVRQVLAYVETGNVDAGLVYATDAQLSDQAQVVATAAADTHAPIIYPIAVVQDTDQAAAAQAFIDFLASETGVAIFQGYGFAMAE
ncbi:MAG: molybdate ABC transporter substrate-binding protein [Leptolyngbyaceae cyanobacterium]